jgi:hypothetical protein
MRIARVLSPLHDGSATARFFVRKHSSLRGLVGGFLTGTEAETFDRVGNALAFAAPMHENSFVQHPPRPRRRRIVN